MKTGSPDHQAEILSSVQFPFVSDLELGKHKIYMTFEECHLTGREKDRLEGERESTECKSKVFGPRKGEMTITCSGTREVTQEPKETHKQNHQKDVDFLGCGGLCIDMLREVRWL